MADAKRIIELDVKVSRDAIRNVEQISQSMKQVESNAARAGNVLRNFLVGGAVVGAGMRIATEFRAIVEQLDAIGDTAFRLGTSVDFVKTLDTAAKLTGNTFADVEGAMNKFGIALTKGGEEAKAMTETLTKLGVDTEGLKNQTADYEEEFQKVMKAIANAPTKYEAFGLAVRVFGKDAAAAMVEVAGKTKEAEEMNRKLFGSLEEATEQAGKAKEAFGKLGIYMDAFGIKIATGVLPYLIDVIDRLNEINNLKNKSSWLWNATIGATPLGMAWTNTQAEKSIVEERANRKDGIYNLANSVDTYGLRLAQAKAVAEGGASGGGTKGTKGAEAKDTLPSLERETIHDPLGYGAPGINADEPGGLEKQWKAAEEAAKEYEDFLDGFEGNYRQFLANRKEETFSFADAWKQVGFTASSAFEDAIFKGEKLGKVMQGLLQDFARVALRQGSSQLFSILGTAIGGYFGGGASAAGAGSSFFSGLKMSASGSIAYSPEVFMGQSGPAMRGEAGPEGVLPLRRGRDGSLGVIATGAGGGDTNNIQVSVTVEASAADKSNPQEFGKQLGASIAAQIDARIMQHKRPGGMLA